MAPDAAEEPDYESDPEELNRSLATRRRVASDDEDEGLKDDDEKPVPNQILSDLSDEQSGIVESHLYDDQIDGDSYDEEEDEDDGDFGEVDDHVEYIAVNDNTSVAGKPKAIEADGTNGEDVTQDSATDLVDGEDQKKKEPFAVPTAGAFYMHDDRFQEMDAGSNRLTMFSTHFLLAIR